MEGKLLYIFLVYCRQLIILVIVFPLTHCEPYVIVFQIAWCQKLSLLIEDTLMKRLVYWITKFETECCIIFNFNTIFGYCFFFGKFSIILIFYVEQIMITNYILANLGLNWFF